MARRLLFILVPALLFAAGCSDNGPTEPDNHRTPLAGGGRLQSDDPFRGGPEDSGPGDPDFEPYSGLVPLFYSDIDCAGNPTQRVITNATDWGAWWKQATSCLWGDSLMHRGPMGMHHGAWGDSVIVDTVYPCDSCGQELPFVDFDSHVVIVISLEPDSGSGCGRYVSVTDVDGTSNGTTVRYEVLELTEDCCALMMRPYVSPSNSPTLAVLAPRPFMEPVTWERSDLKQDCKWEPDPAVPQVLYYTDAPCELGSGETIIGDSARLAEWVKTALACDSVSWSDRWINPGDSTDPGGGHTGTDSVGTGMPLPMPPWWSGFTVDFSTHAVIILRAGETTRWGGGIWLDNIKSTAAGTVIDYSVMIPGDSCPPVGEGLSGVNPTVAIQVPLPLTLPLAWNRRVETIDCNWGTDTVLVGVEPLHPR
jgi:hypothetical protein